MRGIHGAERQLLQVAHRAAVANKVAEITDRFASLKSAAAQRIIGHFADKLTRIDPNLTPPQRHAALEQLRAEEAAALAQLELDIAIEAKRARQSAVGILTAQRKTHAGDLAHRHRYERAALSAVFRTARSFLRHWPLPRPAVRQLAAKIFTRHTLRSMPAPPRR